MMEYGCIGEVLKHSFSKEIHNILTDYDYRLRELSPDEVEPFLTSAEFKAINVTIPYKEKVIPYLYSIDEHAKAIGAVNTIVNRSGKLYGYNTDFYGMSRLLSHAGIELTGRKVIILGTGGTSKTSLAVARALGAREIIRVSRTAREDAIDYGALYTDHTDADIIINTTPSGMFPKNSDCPIILDKFPALSGVVDAVYNPLRTTLISQARERGIPCEGGLYMLVAQAVRASEIFLGVSYPDTTCDEVYKRIVSQKENIVLTGMPASGKSTVGRAIAEALGRTFIDTDVMIEKNAGMTIPDIFARHGEAEFRRLETEAIAEAAKLNAAVIATGGGAILKKENIFALKQNGKIYFIDRPKEALVPTDDRPLSSTVDMIMKRYEERYPIYLKTADKRIDADCTPDEVRDKITEDFLK